MKRSAPIKRRTPLAPGKPPRRKAWPKRKRSTKRKSERVIDVEYREIVKTLPCRVAVTMPQYARDCYGPIDPDHQGKKTAMGQKCDDTLTAPMCRKHHGEREDYAGPFKGWTGDQMRAWLDEQIGATAALVAEAKGML